MPLYNSKFLFFVQDKNGEDGNIYNKKELSLMTSLKDTLMMSPQHNPDPLMENIPEKSLSDEKIDSSDSILEKLSQRKMEAIR